MSLPVMDIQGVGTAAFGGTAGGNTLIQGVITFWNTGSYPVAIIIFTASVVIPILKVAILIWLCLAASGKARTSPKNHALLYHLTEAIGRWSMVDIFVVAIMVTLIQLGTLMTIRPGPAALSFAGVVILTMLAAMTFDPRLLWDHHFRQSKP
jgi:paraquat-inducible protein A